MPKMGDERSQPSPIDTLVNRLCDGDSLGRIVGSRRVHVGHDVRENLLEVLADAMMVEEFGRESVSLRRQAKSTLGLRDASFPGMTRPDIAIRHDGLVHFCEVKPNRIDYPIQ